MARTRFCLSLLLLAGAAALCTLLADVAPARAEKNFVPKTVSNVHIGFTGRRFTRKFVQNIHINFTGRRPAGKFIKAPGFKLRLAPRAKDKRTKGYRRR